MLSLLHFNELNTTLIAPMLTLTFNLSIYNIWIEKYYQSCALIYYMPLEITNEDIANLKELTGNYTIEVLLPKK